MVPTAFTPFSDLRFSDNEEATKLLPHITKFIKRM